MTQRLQLANARLRAEAVFLLAAAAGIQKVGNFTVYSDTQRKQWVDSGKRKKLKGKMGKVLMFVSPCTTVVLVNHKHGKQTTDPTVFIGQARYGPGDAHKFSVAEGESLALRRAVERLIAHDLSGTGYQRQKLAKVYPRGYCSAVVKAA